MADITHLSEVKQDAVLTNLLIGYGSNEFVASEIFPLVPVAKDGDKFYRWKNNGIHTTGLDTRRSDRAQAKEIGLAVEKDDYAVEQHALRDFIEDSVMKNADSILSLQANTAKNIQDTLDLRREMDCKALVFASGTYDSTLRTTLSGNDRWSQIAHADSDPLADIIAAQEAVFKKSRAMPTTLIIGLPGFHFLKQHAKVKESVKYVAKTGADAITVSEIAQYLGVKKIIVGKTIYNTAKEGQTEAPDFVWGSHAALVHIPDNPGINIPAFGYEFRPKHTPRTVNRYRVPDLNGEWIEVNEKRVFKVCFQSAGYLFTNAFTTA